MKTKVWAHRGASAYAPENTMPAFEMAASMGADGIETDIHLTTDGVLVICHDDDLDRVSNGTGPVCEKSFAQLRELDFSNGFAAYKGVKLPTLRELYAFAKEKGLYVNVELKYSGNRWDETNEKTAALAEEYGMSEHLIYSSFKGEPLLKLKKLVSSPVALLYHKPIDQPWVMAKEKGFDALHPEFHRIYEQDMMNQCLKAGIPLHPWTLNEPQDLRDAIQIGVDAVITNKPDLALQIRKEICGE